MTHHTTTCRARAPLFGTLAAMLFIVPAVAQTPDTTHLDQVPRRVLYGLRTRFPKAEVQKWTKEMEGNVQVYDFEFVQERLQYEADVGADGVILNWEIEMPVAQLPARVLETVRAKYPGSSLTHAMRVTEVRDRKDHAAGYELLVHTADGKDVEVTISADGKTIEEGD